MSQNVANGRITAQPVDLLRSALVEPFYANALLVLSLTTMFTVSDAFETESLAMSHSVTLWAIVSFLLVIQTCLTHRLFLSFFSSSPLSRFLAASLALLATVLLMSGELHWFKFTPLLPKQPDPFFEFILFVSQPVFAAGCLTLLSQSAVIQRYVSLLQSSALAEPVVNDGPTELDSILLQNDVLRISAQDHYLEIACSQGKFLVRGRMTDAISAIEKMQSWKGLQVHRSHWVAREHVKQIRHQGRDSRLLLSDGSEVPVARSRSQLLCQLSDVAE